MLLLIFRTTILIQFCHVPKVTETAEVYYSKFRNRLRNHTDHHVKKLLSISVPGNPPPPLPSEDSSVNGLGTL